MFLGVNTICLQPFVSWPLQLITVLWFVSRVVIVVIHTYTSTSKLVSIYICSGVPVYSIEYKYIICVIYKPVCVYYENHISFLFYVCTYDQFLFITTNKIKLKIVEQSPLWCKKCGLLTAIKDAFMMKMSAFIKSSSYAAVASSSAPEPTRQRTSPASSWTDLMTPQHLPSPQSSWLSSPPPSFWWFYELRCNAAVTAYNEGGNRLSSFNKQITDKSPGMYTKQYIKKSMRRIENHSQRRCLFKTSERTKTAAKPLTNTGPDENYGNVLHDPFLDLTENQIEAYKRDYLDKLSLTESQIKILEMRTRRQHQCEEWCIERKKRLTASIFGKVCKMHDKTSRAKTVNDILFGTFTGNAAIRYGIANEVIAKEQLEDLLKTKIQSADDESLVEIKCPASAKELAPEDAIQSNKIKYCSIKDGTLYLKRNDNYYYQVQGQLHISQKTYCYFCLWTPKG
ncbi:hypothetical protein QTP88_007361 [Uroleucon formosanum]